MGFWLLGAVFLKSICESDMELIDTKTEWEEERCLKRSSEK